MTPDDTEPEATTDATVAELTAEFGHPFKVWGREQDDAWAAVVGMFRHIGWTPQRNGFDQVVYLTREQAAVIGGMLDRAAVAYERVRLVIDDGGLKIAVGRQSWTPPLGTTTEPP